MTITQLVVLGVVGLAVALIAMAVRHARTVLDETGMRTGVWPRSQSDAEDHHEGRPEHLRAVDDDDDGADERTA